MSRPAVVPAEVPSYEYAVDCYAQVSREIKALEVAKARLGAVILQKIPDPVESFRARGFTSALSVVYREPRRLKEGVLDAILAEKSPQWIAGNTHRNPEWCPRVVESGFNPANLPADFPSIKEGGGDWKSYGEEAGERLRRVNAYLNYLPLLIAAAKLTP